MFSKALRHMRRNHLCYYTRAMFINFKDKPFIVSVKYEFGQFS